MRGPAALLPASLLLFGAAAADQASLTRLESRVQYVDENNHPLPGRFYSSRITLFFPYLAGRLFGNPQGPPVFVLSIGEDLAFELDLRSGREQIAAGATPLSPAAAAQGLKVAPPSAELARMGTFAYDAATGEQLGAGGFIDAATRESLILIYASEPCRITGSVAAEGTVFDHRVVLPAAGFHWVRVERRPQGRYRLSRHPADAEVYFSIHLLDLGRT